VLCRVDRRRMEVAVDAMRLGALHVLSSDGKGLPQRQGAVKGLNAPNSKPRATCLWTPCSIVGLGPTRGTNRCDGFAGGPHRRW
jgi:hypothetical protein